jgi:hypothetical protein
VIGGYHVPEIITYLLEQVSVHVECSAIAGAEPDGRGKSDGIGCNNSAVGNHFLLLLSYGSKTVNFSVIGHRKSSTDRNTQSKYPLNRIFR